MEDPTPKLAREVEQAREALQAARASQAARRLRAELALQRARARVERLDAELASFSARASAASGALRTAERRLLAPWSGARGNWQRHLAGRSSDGWSSRAWLRIVTRDGRDPRAQWEVQLESPDGDSRDVCFGPCLDPDDDEKLRSVCDDLLAQQGWIPLQK